MRQQSILTALYAYRTITDEEMEQYMRYMAGDNYRHYSMVTLDAIEIGLSCAFNSMGKSIAQKIKEIAPGRECICTD